MELHTFSFHAMGTPCELRLWATPADAPALAGIGIGEVRRLEARYSRYRPDSELSAINRAAAAGATVEVDPETSALLDYADACHSQSGGLFDITSGILRRAWRLAEGVLPDAAQVQALLRHVGWHRVRWAAPRLGFAVPGIELDFGGIVKEYAADRVAELLQQQGVRHGLVNLGGDVRAIGPRPDGSPWRVGVRHPRDPRALWATIELLEGALASSGDYERCIIVGGVRYGHILNPHSGWPVRTMAAVSVLAPLCVVAGSASTIAMLREGDGPAWLADSGLPHLWMAVDGGSGGSLNGSTSLEPLVTPH
jgi:thiamine biosynthesis lipoprotein